MRQHGQLVDSRDAASKTGAASVTGPCLQCDKPTDCLAYCGECQVARHDAPLTPRQSITAAIEDWAPLLSDKETKRLTALLISALNLTDGETE